MILDGGPPVQHPQKSHTLSTDSLVNVRCAGVEIVREQVAVGLQGEHREA